MTLESSIDEATKISTADHLKSLNIAQVTPDQLFDQQHVDGLNPLLLAYFPLGCMLAAVRFAAWVAGIAVDTPWFRQQSVINSYMDLLGVRVTWRNAHNIPKQRHVLVSNHISVGDLLILFQQPQRYVHLITNALPGPVYSTQHLPAILQPANKETYLCLAEQLQQGQQVQQLDIQQQHSQLPLQHLQQGQLHGASFAADGQQHHIQAATAAAAAASSNGGGGGSSIHVQQASLTAEASNPSSSSSSRALPAAVVEAPVHLFPEGGMTNGSGMMKFSRGFMLFADKLPVVPVALRMRVAFPQVKSHTMSSSFLSNLFWFSFQPWTEIEATALPAMQLQPGEGKAAFVQRVQLAIAQELKVWVSDMNIQQKRQLVKKQQKQQRRR